MINILVLALQLPIAGFGALGSIMLKKGSKHFKLSNIYKNKEIILGLFFFGLSMVFYLVALKLADLSVVYPLSSFTYAAMAILSVRYLGEKMSVYKWLGITFIILGSFFIVS